jgi:hypothetical protein
MFTAFKGAATDAPGSSVSVGGLSSPSRPAASPICTPDASTTETPGAPRNSQEPLPVLVNTTL